MGAIPDHHIDEDHAHRRIGSGAREVLVADLRLDHGVWPAARVALVAEIGEAMAAQAKAAEDELGLAAERAAAIERFDAPLDFFPLELFFGQLPAARHFSRLAQRARQAGLVEAQEAHHTALLAA